MSNDWVQDIEKMNEKFGVMKRMETFDTKHLLELLRFRLDMCDEESRELEKAYNDQDAEGIVDAMIDRAVFDIQTLLMLGVCPNTAWDRVLEANMTKEPGVKPSRPNPFGFPDLIKPEGWTAPDHSDNHGKLDDIF